LRSGHPEECLRIVREPNFERTHVLGELAVAAEVGSTTRLDGGSGGAGGFCAGGFCAGCGGQRWFGVRGGRDLLARTQGAPAAGVRLMKFSASRPSDDW
jgi:hypothetical protein